MVGGDEMESTQTIQPDEVLKEEKKEDGPDFVVVLLKNIVNTILLEEVAGVGTKMNKYRGVIAVAVLKFAEGHEDDVADLSRLVDAFRAGWKVYREDQDEKGAVDTFMKEMNNTLWEDEGYITE